MLIRRFINVYKSTITRLGFVLFVFSFFFFSFALLLLKFKYWKLRYACLTQGSALHVCQLWL